MTECVPTQERSLDEYISTVGEGCIRELRALADESNRSISGLLTEAIREFVQRRRVRPVVRRHPEDSLKDNERLGRLLGE